MKSHSQPGLIASLFLSCSRPEFYSSVSAIPWWRSLFFLLFYSFLGALGLVFLLYRSIFILSNPQQDVLKIYDQVIPEIEGAYSDGVLEVDPHEFSFVAGLDENSQFYIRKKQQKDALLEYQLEVDTLRTASERDTQAVGLGIYRDGVVMNTGFGGESISFEDAGITGDFIITKQSLRESLVGIFPDILETTKDFLIWSGPVLFTLYLFFSGLLQALLFSFFGSLSLLIRGTSFHYFDLIKLSFYAGFPSLLFLVVSLILNMPVSWMPVMIHVVFYFIGLHCYRGSQKA